MKKTAIMIAIVIVVLLGAWGAFGIRDKMMEEKIEAAYVKIKDVGLAKVPDGVYPGKFGDFLVSVDLEVSIKNHRINTITIKNQVCGKGYDARATVDQIVQAQSPKVDAIAGATLSSKCIMIATGRALKGK